MMKEPVITGHSTNGKPTVFSRLFTWKDQEGLPIDFSANFVIQQGMIPDWLHEIEGALWVGYTEDKIIAELSEAFTLLYPGKSKELMTKVKAYLIMRQTPNAYTMNAIKATTP
jgi:hypothetical protein